MEANELRIGNYVYEKGKLKELHSISNHNAKDYSKTKPIPLTEEWLVKLGCSLISHDFKNYYSMELVDNLHFYSNPKRSGFVIGEFECECGQVTDDIDVDIIEVKYVHTFQNLYFALTGEELIIKS